MRFFKNNSDDIVKLYINQICIAIFSFFLYTAAGALSEKINDALAMKIFISVFSIAFYFVLIYNVAWEIGAKDKIRIDGKRMEKNKKKGILLGIYANSLNFIVLGIAIILSVLYITSGIDAFNTIFAILNFLFRFFLSMYLGVIQGITSFITDSSISFLVQTILFFVFAAVSAVITHVSYILGLRDFRFFATAKSKK